MSLGLLLLLWETIVEDALEVVLLPGVFLLVFAEALGVFSCVASLFSLRTTAASPALRVFSGFVLESSEPLGFLQAIWLPESDKTRYAEVSLRRLLCAVDICCPCLV